MRRRRRFKGTWFPLYGTPLGPSEPGVEGQGINFNSIITQTDGSAATIVQQLTADEPLEDASSYALTDIVGSTEYALRRIVGKLSLAWAELSGEGVVLGAPYIAKIAAGLLIARADDQDSRYPLGCPGVSFGSTGDPDAFNSFSPLALRTMREPWIWRRTWLLGNPVYDGGPTPAPYTNGRNLIVPSSNLWCGSVLDGPHIDAKTKRRCRQDERLFFAISAANWPFEDSPQVERSLVFSWDLDVRIFGALRRARNKGAF